MRFHAFIIAFIIALTIGATRRFAKLSSFVFRDKNKVDLNKEMLAQLDVGAHSQNRINMVRENQLLGQWRNLLKEAADRQQPNVSVGSWENQHGAR